MLKCPFCGFDNEDGALFCEQCKSDLSMVPVSAPAIPMAAPLEPLPVAAMHATDPVPMAAFVEDTIPMASIEPPTAAPVEPPMAAPLAAEMHGLPNLDLSMPAPPPPAFPEFAPPPPPPPPAPTPPPIAEVPPPAPMAAAVGAVVEPPTPVAVDAPPPAAAVAPTQPAPAPAPAQPAAPAEGAKLPAGAQPRLKVVRGQRINVEFPIYEGMNFIGRADDKPVDIDLDDQEPPDRVWCSRQHALVTFEDGMLMIEDLNSANGTYVNRQRVYPGRKVPLNVNDVIQIGTVQMKVAV